MNAPTRRMFALLTVSAMFFAGGLLARSDIWGAVQMALASLGPYLVLLEARGSHD